MRSLGPDKLAVLLSLDPPDGTTKYVVQLTEGMPADVSLRYFSWKTAIFGKYDVFHVHWPEFLIRAGSKGKTAVKMAAFLLFIARLSMTRTPVVRTVHNLRPHEDGNRVERILTNLLERRTSLYVRLNPTTETPPGKPVATILHGHYRDWFASEPKPEPVVGRLLNFGLIRPYKGVEELIDIVEKAPTSDVTLRIVGKPMTDELRQTIEAVSQRCERVSSALGFAPDADLVREISMSEMVVLPYRFMHNSGAVLLALSLDRPVLVPDNEVNRLLEIEVGSDWVHRYHGDLALPDIERALKMSRQRVSGQPTLGGRDWASVGSQHSAAYWSTMQPARSGGA
ncbi:GDP-mannose:glycolipid 4-beta-D-mannosyltransferase [Prescottella equi]|nr:GDP-mannose:glycolipid 4-beta-D-mannosyltransferase [Prescottella equi]BCN65693.1 GDP-mannose:glycolipid 4-beta-D-mannosyltransferase [Prescottella equi]BCN75537.1 GDP-mannose:glycolipid 4-beta-D-mannosyltransferase [Prescottella equi]